MSKTPTPGSLSALTRRPQWRIALAVALLLGVLIGGWLIHRAWNAAPTVAPPSHNYAEALELAHNGKPGAARVLYQQLGRTDLSDIRRAGLLTELANYPSPQALKLLKAELRQPQALSQQAAIDAISAMVPAAQLSLLFGPLLEDPDQTVRFSAAKALLGLTPDDVGLYFGPLQVVAEELETALAAQPPNGESQIQLARLYMITGARQKAVDALTLALTLEPDNLQAGLAQVDLLDQQGQADRSRQQLAQLLQKHPHASLLQHALGQWLLRHGQHEYALLALAKAVELEPENTDYRYDLAVALHDLEQLEPAQRQLEDILQRQPANRRARVLLIHYWKESGQLQKVQVLLAELEQQNPDDPVLQQGL
jgi:tetratricopeptide (TPR) repeat protein